MRDLDDVWKPIKTQDFFKLRLLKPTVRVTKIPSLLKVFRNG